MSFALDISRFVDRSKGNVDKAVRETLTLASQQVVMRSPVGDPSQWKVPVKGYVGGRFRANWNFSVGSPDYATTENVDAGGGATLARIAGQIATTKAGTVAYLSNGLPYGRRLEYEGWSKQAPQGMVRLTAMEMPDVIRNFPL